MAFRYHHAVGVPKTVDLEEGFRRHLEKFLTTAMLRNVPNGYTQSSLLEEIVDEGCGGSFDFFYLPIDTRSRMNVGYAFINFLTSDYMSCFAKRFGGYKFKRHSRHKIARVCLAHIQGFEENIRHFANRAVARSQHSPFVLHQGQRIDLAEAYTLLCKNGSALEPPTDQSAVNTLRVQPSVPSSGAQSSMPSSNAGEEPFEEEFTVGAFLQPPSDAALDVQSSSNEDWWQEEKSRLEATSAEWKRQRDELDAELTATKAACQAAESAAEALGDEKQRLQSLLLRLQEEGRCTVVQEPWREPVIASDGFTYEREAIEAWMRRSPSSPLTRELLRLQLYPNRYAARIQLLLQGGLPGSPAVVQSKTLQELAPPSATALLKAVQSGQRNTALGFLRMQPLPGLNAVGPDGSSVLHMAIRQKLPDVAIAVLMREDFLAVIAVTQRGVSALHWAAFQGYLPVCQAIIARSDCALLWATTNRGKTALQMALDRGHVAVAEFLRGVERRYE